MEITAQGIIALGGVASAVALLIGFIWKLFKWVSHQKEQDAEIARIEHKHDREIAELRALHNHDRDGIQEEQTLIVYGLLACLKGLQEQGCDGPVSAAIEKIEKHINKKAHSQD